MADTEEKRRIVALEAEVQALRDKLREESTPGPDSPAHDGPRGNDPAGEFAPSPSKAKVVLLSVIVALVGLAMIFAIFSVLAKGFDRFAGEAAKKLTPSEESALGVPNTKVVPSVRVQKPPDAGEPKERVLVPGL
ncbi:MAG: hypothetical protein JRH20_16025 [Deltaproteobacteria bacterium]|nr:hypothetical protein [Deltaproteobacteria bacterium]